jgi:hypothetical protein
MVCSSAWFYSVYLEDFFDSLSIYLQYCFVFLSCIYVHALDLLQALLSSYKESGQFVGLLVA